MHTLTHHATHLKQTFGTCCIHVCHSLQLVRWQFLQCPGLGVIVRSQVSSYCILSYSMLPTRVVHCCSACHHILHPDLWHASRCCTLHCCMHVVTSLTDPHTVVLENCRRSTLQMEAEAAVPASIRCLKQTDSCVWAVGWCHGVKGGKANEEKLIFSLFAMSPFTDHGIDIFCTGTWVCSAQHFHLPFHHEPDESHQDQRAAVCHVAAQGYAAIHSA